MPVISPEQPLRVPAYAKLNLGLEIVGRRSDGYHELVTIFQTISLADRITILPANELSYSSIDGVELENDLVMRAFQLTRSRWQVELLAAITVEKQIPMAAGLGGGSADAAAILRVIAGLAGLPLDEVTAAGTALGADVPFLIEGGTALGTGTGTNLKPIPATMDCWFTIIVPELDIPRKTATLYRALSSDSFSDGSATLAQAERLRSGQPLDVRLITNPFEALLSTYSGFEGARIALKEASGLPVHVSGAGPALFTVCRNRAHATSIAAEMTNHGYRSLSCQAVATG